MPLQTVAFTRLKQRQQVCPAQGLGTDSIRGDASFVRPASTVRWWQRPRETPLAILSQPACFASRTSHPNPGPGALLPAERSRWPGLVRGRDLHTLLLTASPDRPRPWSTLAVRGQCLSQRAGLGTGAGQHRRVSKTGEDQAACSAPKPRACHSDHSRDSQTRPLRP